MLPHERQAWHYRKDKIRYTRALRQRMTPVENELWNVLRNRQFYGCKFRRQCVFGAFIADFCCHERLLIVEIDGDVHAETEQYLYDRNRDAYLRQRGYSILRITNSEWYSDKQRVLESLQEALKIHCA